MSESGSIHEIIRLGSEEAEQHCRRHVTPEVLWMALCRVNDPVVAEVFREQKCERGDLLQKLRVFAQQRSEGLKPVVGAEVKISEDSFRHLKHARQAAETAGRHQPLAGDLLLELSENVDTDIDLVLREAGTKGRKLAEGCRDRLKHLVPEPALPGGEKGPAAGRNPLAAFGLDYSELAREKRIGPVVGRRQEILHVLQVLARKQKNNPVLIGEPGVGKTSVVEGIALRALEPTAPAIIRGKRVVEISLSRMIAGTKYRGEFEERLNGVLAEAERDDSVILFLDEIHMLVGAGAAGSDAMDAANIMKPALARGRLKLIGATTPDEYRKHIEADAALERRFQPVAVREPTPAETVEILTGLKETYEAHHGVKYLPEALQAAVELTVRYVPERRLPDKARDALDQAAAQSRIRTLSNPAEAQPAVEIGREQVAATIAAWKGIPVEQLNDAERDHLRDLGSRLRGRVKGQDHVVDALAQSVQIALLGLSNPSRPHGVFLFAGPTGVGKTELARALASELFGSEAALIRIDMSEYMEAHAVSRLVGAPPGYVGHDEGALLTDAVRQRPFCVVLLDEIEKAHPAVVNLFLQVFDDGRLTDSKGRIADFRNTIIVMTSNLGAAEGNDDERGVFGLQPNPEPSEKLKQCVEEAVREHFPPEFVGRLSGVFVFNSLDRATARLIVDKFLKRLQEQLQPHRVRLDFSDDVYDLLLEVGFSVKYGARPLERAIEQLLRVEVARSLLDRPPLTDERTLSVLREGDRMRLVWDDELDATSFEVDPSQIDPG